MKSQTGVFTVASLVVIHYKKWELSTWECLQGINESVQTGAKHLEGWPGTGSGGRKKIRPRKPGPY
jgi:hypothetical protein